MPHASDLIGVPCSAKQTLQICARLVDFAIGQWRNRPGCEVFVRNGARKRDACATASREW